VGKGQQGAPSYSQSFYYNFRSNKKIQAIPSASNRPHTKDQIKKDKNGKERGKSKKKELPTHKKCRNPSFVFATKLKGLQGCEPRGVPGVTSHTPESARKCEGVNPHTPKATPTLGDGVPVDSRNFRERFEGSNRNAL